MLTADERRAESRFAALRVADFRRYLLGQAFANTGSWIQSIAQDWLVLRLTGSPSAVGLTMALQFLPILLFGVHGGALADRMPKRALLIGTQLTNALLTGALALLTISGHVDGTDVFLFAGVSGLVFAVDAPTRQAFVSEVVPLGLLRKAIALNAAVFQATRLVGPAIAGILVGTVGAGWAFAANAACYLAPTVCLLLLRSVHPAVISTARPGARALRDTLGYVRTRPRLAWTVLLVGTIGTFGLNFPIVLTAFAKSTFHGTALTYAAFNIALAIGSVGGALIAAGLPTGRMRLITASAVMFGAVQALAAVMPGYDLFLVLLVCLGLVNLAFQAVANASVQLWVEPGMRGRVMGLYMLVFVGGTPVGAPIIGVLTSAYGPRVGMAVCGIVPLVAALGVAAMLSPRATHARLMPRRPCPAGR